jgi:DNA-binding winged helix-turn-helix (wHTH) protein/tetratricopeptide (TPR) repeat protein
MEKAPEEMRRFGPFEANVTTGELRKHGIRLKLQDQPFQVLKMLLARPRELVTREEIRQRLWPSGTFVDFDNGLNASVNRLREALGDSAENPKFIETLPRRGYRFIGVLDGPAPAPSTADIGQGLQRANRDGESSRSSTATAENPLDLVPASARRRWVAIAGGAALVIIGLAVACSLYFRQKDRASSRTQSVVLTDFTNTTGEPVFDGTLRQGLTVQLEQSPFFSVLSGQRVQQTLRMMGQSGDVKLTLAIASEVCQRTQSSAVLDGSIANLGNQYVLGLKAVDCRTGDTLAEEQATASGKERVLKTLSEAASKLRRKLGESLSSLDRFDTPIEQATTNSLEALKAVSLGLKARYTGEEHNSFVLFRRAVDLDPNFAMAYGLLGSTYYNFGDEDGAIEALQKAYDLRDRTSERERFRILTYYHLIVTRELEKMRENCEEWVLAYPKDGLAHGLLADALGRVGLYEKATEEGSESLRLNPENFGVYSNQVDRQLALGRLNDAEVTLREAEKLNFGLVTRADRYVLAFLRGDAAEMKAQVDWFANHLEMRAFVVVLLAQTEASAGRLVRARELMRRSAVPAGEAGRPAFTTRPIIESQWEVEFGNSNLARQQVMAASPESSATDVQALAALVLARAGDASRAQALAGRLARRLPRDTLMNAYWLPTIDAAIELRRRNPGRAMQLLEAAAPYELAVPYLASPLYPAYLRGEAYLLLRQETEAAREFQKLLDHRGLVGNDPLGSLARLGLARARALQGNSGKAHAAYKDFFALWKDADPDIPILKQAKEEYARLQ